MSDAVTSAGGRPLSKRGERTRRRLLEAAEAVFAELGYHEASIVKITEAAGVGQGTFYLYFASKKDVFDELVVDLNHRVRQAMEAGEIAAGDPELLAWALMGIGELVGMRWILWAGRNELPADVQGELDRIVTRTLGSRNGST